MPETKSAPTWCMECRAEGKDQRVKYRLGAWMCPVHHDRCHITAQPPDTGMSVERAKALAVFIYADRRDKLGYQEFDHVAAVAAAVPESAKAVAWLHDAFEDGLLTARQLYREMSADQFEALLLVTREPALGLTYQQYIREIAEAEGRAGAIAREIKLADLGHNMTRPCPPEMMGMRESGGRYGQALRALEAAVGISLTAER